jgi:hypothetical protein
MKNTTLDSSELDTLFIELDDLTSLVTQYTKDYERATRRLQYSNSEYFGVQNKLQELLAKHIVQNTIPVDNGLNYLQHAGKLWTYWHTLETGEISMLLPAEDLLEIRPEATAQPRNRATKTLGTNE